MTGKLKVDECSYPPTLPVNPANSTVITHRKNLNEINDAFRVMHDGNCIRYIPISSSFPCHLVPH